MVYRKGGLLQGKLADLEYAKKYPNPINMPPAVDPKTVHIQHFLGYLFYSYTPREPPFICRLRF